jgi:hypothetical protein
MIYRGIPQPADRGGADGQKIPEIAGTGEYQSALNVTRAASTAS